MADSLNTSIQKLGDTLSAKLFGNSKENPEGAENFSGVYIGPGGGVTRMDSFTIDSERYGGNFIPPGYFDKTNQWVDGRLSTIIKEFPGVTHDDLIVSGNTKIKGFIPPGYFTRTKQWIDNKLSSLIRSFPGTQRDFISDHNGLLTKGYTPPGYFNSTGIWVDNRLKKQISGLPGISREDLPNITGEYKYIGWFTPPGFFDTKINEWVDNRPNKDELPGISRSAYVGIENPDTSTIDKPGFTPVAYYRTGDEILLMPSNNTFLGYETAIGVVSSEEALSYSKKTGDDGFFESTRSSDYRFKFGLEDDKLLSTIDNSSVTPMDNEDPLFLGFEVVIDVPNSPLFNGEAARFIEKFNSNTEIRSRGPILADTMIEFSKFFKFNAAFFNPVNLYTDSIFSTPPNPKRHYVKKVSGLDRLIEANTPSAQAAFTKYRQDLIKISFYEDTNLNLGTLASLYKLIYWSRINGKNIIPENLLRFDCYIVASEVRNLTRVVKAANGQAGLRTLKENVSRYVYNLYECQLFFDKMTHGDSIDIGGGALSSPDSLELSISYKYSTMKFERYNFIKNNYAGLRNDLLNPTQVRPSEANTTSFDGNTINNGLTGGFMRLNNGYLGKDTVSDKVITYDNYDFSDDIEITNTLGILSSEQKREIYNKYFVKEAVEGENKSGQIYDTNKTETKVPLNANNGSLYTAANPNTESPQSQLGGQSLNLYGKPLSTLSVESTIPLTVNQNSFSKASERLLQNVKKAALSEAQRQLNNQFRLINNSLDKVRNSFGIGRMREPTNVYTSLPNAQFFFDVKNSLRDFGGDVLGGLLGG